MATDAAAPVIETSHLTKIYQNRQIALNDATLTIEPGTVLGLLGPNGAGKTTWISIVCGLTRATAGRATVFGHDVVADPIPARRVIGLVPQEVNFDPFFTSREVLRFEPFYSRRHRSGSGPRAYWHASQRPSDSRLEDGAQLWLSLIDRSGRPLEPDFDIVTLRCTCSNRDLPSRLPFGNENGDFEMDAASSIKRIVALRKPTGVLRATAGKASLWRLVSQLSLNYLSLVEDGKESLQEILRLYDFSSAAHFERQIAGIESLSSRRHFARVVSESGISFVRGTRVEMELNEEEFVGGGVYLFSSVLEQFLGLYASLNSFSQLVVKTKQRKEALKQWPPRAGQSILL